MAREPRREARTTQATLVTPTVQELATLATLSLDLTYSCLGRFDIVSKRTGPGRSFAAIQALPVLFPCIEVPPHLSLATIEIYGWRVHSPCVHAA